MCQPAIHPYNRAIIELYNVCCDQLITGSGGIVGINDLAVAYAMDNYFIVRKREKLPLSLGVRRFFRKVLVVKTEK